MNWLNRLIGGARDTTGEALYTGIVAQARAPHWYEAGEVPDTIDGRFDMIAAILSLVLLRLEGEPAAGGPSARLTERFVEDMDAQLREIGVGDIGVGKHIGKMMGMLGGRLGAYRDGLAAGDLDAALRRNLYRGDAPDDAAVGHVGAALLAYRDALAVVPSAALIDGAFAVTAPEFSRVERSDAIGEGERRVAIAADDVERAAIANRFGLIAIDRLEGAFRLRREGGGIVVTGSVSAAVVQPCSVTDEPVPATVDEPVALRFVSEADAAEEEIELDAGALDVLPFDGAAIDLGEIAAETMALALDPFPRAAGAAAALREAGVIGEDEVRPVNALAGLKDLLAGSKG